MIPTRRKGALRETSGINLSPLIDMTFLLLIFFMVTTTFVRDLAVEIERPGAQSVVVADPRALRVAVDRRGGVYVEDRLVKIWMLQGRLREQLQRSRVKSVLVVADSDLPTGLLVEVVDQCRLAGAGEVGLAVERREP